MPIFFARKLFPQWATTISSKNVSGSIAIYRCCSYLPLSEKVNNISPEETGPASSTSCNTSSRRTGEVDAFVRFEPKMMLKEIERAREEKKLCKAGVNFRD